MSVRNEPSLEVKNIEGTNFGKYSQQYSKGRDGYPKPLYEHLVNLINDSNAEVLDVACGTGIATNELQPYFPNVQGLDIDDAMLYQARKIEESKDKSNRINYIHGDATKKIPFEDKKFSLITVCTAFHWLCKDEKATQGSLPELFRVLKPGGILAIVHIARDLHNDPLSKELKAVIGDIQKKYIKRIVKHPKIDNPDFDPIKIMQKFNFETPEEVKAFSQIVPTDLEKELARVQSTSRWNEIDPEDQPAALNEMRERMAEIFKKLGDIQPTIEAWTRLYIGRRPIDK